jgi:inward rectifier potassium channel
VAVVQADGVEAPMLMFRAANQRHNLIFEAEVRVSVLLDEVVLGTAYRRFQDLKLERASNPLFTLSWTIMHRIDADSPLYGWLTNRCVPGEVDVVVVVSGVDAHSGQLIHGRWAYSAHDIRWGHRLVDIVQRLPSGERLIDYGRFHDTELLPSV